MSSRTAIRIFVQFVRCRSGNFALLFALLAPLLIGLVGGAIDFYSFQSQKLQMQQVADAAALAAAKEANIKSGSDAVMQSIAEAYAQANLKAANGATYTATAELDSEDRNIAVTIEMDNYRYFLLGYFRHDPQISVTATATISGDMPICVVGLEQKADNAISITGQGAVVADQCAVYANSESPVAIKVDSKATLDSGFTCSAAGYEGAPSSFKPIPTTDCPTLEDPLASRPAPKVGACDYTNHEVKNGTFTLKPGTYCGGLLIDNNADVTMEAGTYVINGGEFRIRNNGSLKGDGVGFYFTGADGRAVFDGTSEISLKAPVSGNMAGLLFFQDPDMDETEYEISSKNAAVLLGTIYLPNGRLKVHANNPVAEASAFTVIVAKLLDIGNKAQLHINSGYSSTPVPVPDGLGPNSNALLSN